MLQDANATAIENAKNADMMIAAENARVEDARKVACSKIDDLEDQLQSCIKALERIKTANLPATGSATGVFDYEQAEHRTQDPEADAVAAEIAANLQALVGTTDEPIPTAEPKHPVTDTTTSKFANLQFGRNYDPTKR